MRRKKLEYNFCQNVEWMESPENHGLVIPFHRIFCPNLSKSAPCKCCPGGTQSTDCTNCSTAFKTNNPIYIDDSVYGANIASFNPNLGFIVSTTVTVLGYSTSPDCVNQPAAYNISMPISYQFSCTPGSPSFLRVSVSYTICGTSPSTGMRINQPSTAAQASSTQRNLPQFCDLSSPLAFTIPAEGNFTNGNPKLYPGGATITFHR